MKRFALLACATTVSLVVFGHDRAATRASAQSNPNVVVNPNTYQDLRWRSIGPLADPNAHRGGANLTSTQREEITASQGRKRSEHWVKRVKV